MVNQQPKTHPVQVANENGRNVVSRWKRGELKTREARNFFRQVLPPVHAVAIE